MKTQTAQQLKQSINRWLWSFIILLLLSGITAFPIESELFLLQQWSAHLPPTLHDWITQVYTAVSETNRSYPFMAYGTDWLAFAHIVIAVAFIGPLRDPVRNIWILQFGMIACALVIPLAFTCGYIRHIPLYWQLIDCSFGVIGWIPLYICYRNILSLQQLTLNNQSYGNK